MVYEIPKLIRDDADHAHTFILGKRMNILCRNDFWGWRIRYRLLR